MEEKTYTGGSTAIWINKQVDAVVPDNSPIRQTVWFPILFPDRSKPPGRSVVHDQVVTALPATKNPDVTVPPMWNRDP